jgi:hypothetical protein
VAAAIEEGYPADLARGYKLGDIRGAFSLSKPLQALREDTVKTLRRDTDAELL